MKNVKRVLGCIADDFTGASDAASFLQKSGLRVVLFNETPTKNVDISSYDAIVIALKTRTLPVEDAVKISMNAVKWLEQAGATFFYSKYCSTFDSTREGNIGPIADTIMEYLDIKYTLLCPALPVNGRIVIDGNLYVNGLLLNESPMKNHPLTPMWDSRIKNLMEAQSKYKAYEIGKKMEDTFSHDNEEHYYLIPDYEDDGDSRRIMELYGDLKFLTGGSGILQFWAEHLFEKKEIIKRKKGVIIAGSCSKATLEQIQVYDEGKNKLFKIDPMSLLEDNAVKEKAIEFVRSYPEKYVLIYTSDTAENVKEIQKSGKEKIAAMIEDTLSDIAVELVAEGYTNIIVAGGETSGAVTQKLGYSAFKIGKSVAPGVPVMMPIEDMGIRLVLKSGNFGQPDFFEKAIMSVEENGGE